MSVCYAKIFKIMYKPNEKGNTIIRAGDTILTMTDLKDEWKVRELMDSLTTIE